MIIYLGNKLAEKGKNPTAIDTLGKRLQECYPTLIRVSSKSNFVLRLLDMWWSILINRKEVKLVIIDTYSTLAFTYAWTSARLCRMLNIAYLPIIHGGNFENRIVKSKKKVTEYLLGAQNIVTPSAFLQRVISKNLSFKAVIIPNAIALKDFSNSGSATFQSTPRIFWLRAYQELYNPVLAVQIIHELKMAYGIAAELIMVGPDKDGSFAKVKAKITELSLENNVRLHQGLPRHEWVKLATSCSVFLNTTTVDNTPVSLIEAMALGLPIVSTSVGGIPDLVENQKEGFLFSTGDHVEAAKLIFQIHQDADLWQKVSTSALGKAETFDWQKSIKSQWNLLLDNYD